MTRHSSNRDSFRRNLWIAAGVVVALGGAYAIWSSSQSSIQSQRVDQLVREAVEIRDLQDKSSEALLKLREAEKLAPTSGRVLLELGRTLRALSKNSEAREVLERAYEEADAADRPRICLELGNIHRERFSSGGELSDFRRANYNFEEARSDPDCAAEALFHLGFLALRLERNKTITDASDVKKGRRYLQDLIKDHPDFENIDQARKLLEVLDRLGSNS